MKEHNVHEHRIHPEAKASIDRPHVRYWQVLTAVALMAMELAWVVPWYRLLTWTSAPTTRLQAFAVLGVTLTFAYFSMQFLDYFQLKRKYTIATMAICLTVAVVVGFKLLIFLRESVSLRFVLRRIFLGCFESVHIIPPEAIAILAILMIWQRGVSLARERLGSLSVERGFKRGLILLAVNGLVAYPLIRVIPTVDLYGFLFFGLVAMGAARLSSLSRLRGGKKSPFDRRWVFGVLGFAAVVLVVGAIFTLLAKGPLTTGVTYLITIAVNLFSRVLVIVLWPVVFAGINGLMRIVDWINLQRMDGLESAQSLQTQNELTEWLQQMQQADPPTWIEQIVPVLKSALLWGLVCLILAFLLLRLQRLIRENGQDGEASERDSLLSEGGLIGLLRNAFRRRTDSLLQNLERWRNPERRLAAARIRRIYADLMQLSEELDCIRPASQTPLEFLTLLGQIFPDFSHELVAITHAYVRVRYGELPETPQELEIVEDAWRQVQAAGEERKRDQKGMTLSLGI